MSRIRKGGYPPPGFGVESSDEDDDVNDPFAALSSKPGTKNNNNNNKKLKTTTTTIHVSAPTTTSLSSSTTTTTTSTIPSTTTTTTTSTNVKKKQQTSILDDSLISSDLVDTTTVVATPEATTGSTSSAYSSKIPTKRHHGVLSDTRKAKMDALLLELQSSETIKLSSNNNNNNNTTGSSNKGGRSGSIDGGTSNNHQSSHHTSYPTPHGTEKKGSFVDPSEEHITTNIFVGNLAPSITEEEMTDLFRQFGDLYSVKIMWPRTAEERIRNRHTGFVCFMNRNDAEDALNTCNETDPFNVGRRLLMRWGKNVKKIVKRGTGGIPIAPIEKQQQQQRKNQPTSSSLNALKDIPTSQSEMTVTTLNECRPTSDGTLNPILSSKFIVPSLTASNMYKTIRVQIPSDIRRAKFISTVASFVAKDGYQLERLILAKESVGSSSCSNATETLSDSKSEFDFLLYPIGTENAENENYQRRVNEHQYYKWRVYSFCHGDTYHKWNKEPFVMFQPFGSIWIPPADIDEEAAKREELELQRKEEEIVKQRKQRQLHAQLSMYATGRQLEQQQRLKSKGRDGTTKEELSKSDRKLFDQLLVHDLCASRKSICEAMAFCFGKNFAVNHITSLLQDLMLVVDPTVCSVDTMIARMFLVSDILFNSQQPGVKNAFQYRDWIQKNSPNIFASIGTKYKLALPGRMTQERLTAAFHAILAAWANWGVFDPIFLDELDARYQGKEFTSNHQASIDAPSDDNLSHDLNEQNIDETEAIVVYDKPQSEWIEVEPENPELDVDILDDTRESINKDCTSTCSVKSNSNKIDKPAGTKEDLISGQTVIQSIGDNPIDDFDPDGEPIEDDDDPDGEPLDEDDDPDGVPLEEDDDPDGEPLSGDDEDVTASSNVMDDNGRERLDEF